MDNRIAFTLSDAEQKQISDALQVIFDTLKPHTIVLSDLERRTLPKMADATLPFVQKVQTYASTHAQFKPSYVNADDLAIDIAGYKLSNRFLAPSYDLVRLLEDISILSGSEAYMAALSYYRNVQSQMKDGQPNAKAVFDDLQTRFVSQSKKATPPPKA